MKLKRLVGVFVFAGTALCLASGPALHAAQEAQETALEQPLVQEAAPRPAPIRLLRRGDVLMPNDPLLKKMAEHQERSQRAYKSMTFEQHAVVERYKPRKRLQESSRATSRREIVARYSPDGKGELKPTLVSDSDPKADKKAKKKKKKGKGDEGREQSLAEQLISPILFPMTTENVQRCKFTVRVALPTVALLQFEPEGMNTEPIFSGQVLVSRETGEIYRLEIDGLFNFEKVNKRFKYLKELNVAVDYTEQPGGYRFPTYMHGQGYAKVLWVKGNFRFDIEESGYRSGEAVAAGRP